MKKVLCFVLVLMLVVASVVTLTACESSKTLLIWGPSDHEAIYLEWVQKFVDQYPDQFAGYKVQFAGSGDVGAYAAMAIDPSSGAAVYTFSNDQMANLVNLASLSAVTGDNLKWSQEHNATAAYDATFIGDKSYAYPLQADNGYYMYYNKSAFRNTSVWDKTNDCLKEGYTFRDLYNALDENTGKYTGYVKENDQLVAKEGGAWKDGKITWAMGDSWYVSGVFFAVGGNYEVKYDQAGKQSSADCWFSYTLPEGVTDKRQGDYTVGLDAYQCLKNTITVANDDNTVNSHYLYSDGDKHPLNENIDIYTNANNNQAQTTPLAAAICGTWKAKALQEVWGDDYAATVLPMLETDDGEMFAMKNFAGYKHIGVNPQCAFAKVSPENLLLLHKLAQYLSDKEVSLARYASTGAGPANLAALEDDQIKNDLALIALNAQYDRICKYPDNYAKEDLRGKEIDNGLGYRIQDSVPANYWTPIQKFGNILYVEFSEKKFDKFKTKGTTMDFLAELQSEISKAAQ